MLAARRGGVHAVIRDALTLPGGVLLLRDSLPDLFGWIGVGLIVIDMVLRRLA